MEIVFFIIGVSACSILGCYIGKRLFISHHKSCRFTPCEEIK